MVFRMCGADSITLTVRQVHVCILLISVTFR
jgi:hypothetical protein